MPMPPDAGAVQKADQIAHRFFTKFALLVDNARNLSPADHFDRDGSGTIKTDKWFNLETPDTEAYKEHLRAYRSLSTALATRDAQATPPLELDVLLSVPELTANQVLVHHPPSGSRVRVDPTPTHILLERWVLAFVPNPVSSHGHASGTPSTSSSTSSSSAASEVSGDTVMGAGEVTLATVYKHAMAVFRSLYTLLMLLPAARICKRLRRRGAGGGARMLGPSGRSNGNLGIMLRVKVRGSDAEGDDSGMSMLGFDSPLSSSSSPLPTLHFNFDPVPHPMGSFSLGVTYLETPHFALDTLESLLSSRFLAQEPEVTFTPTLASRGREGASITAAGLDTGGGGPGSLPMRIHLPRSPPQSIPSRRAMDVGAGLSGPASLAQQFVIPAYPQTSGSRTSLPSTSPRSRALGLPSAINVQRSASAQAGATAGSLRTEHTGSGGSVGSSSRLSREEGRDGLGRVRRESFAGRSSSSDLPSASAAGVGAVPIRRPPMVQAFKSSTLSSGGSPSMYSTSTSLSQRHTNPLSALPGPSLPARPVLSTIPPASPTSTRRLHDIQSMNQRDLQSASSAGGITAFRASSSPVLPLSSHRPSPPIGASPGERRFPITASSTESTEPPHQGTAAAVGSVPLTAPTRKRYSSSFGHRYDRDRFAALSAGGVGSDGSASAGGSVGSGDRREAGDRPGSGAGSYLSANAEDDDISAFVQAIDARKPIGGYYNSDSSSRRDRELQSESHDKGGQVEIIRQRSMSRPGAVQRASPSPGRSPNRRDRTISDGPCGSPLARHAAAEAAGPSAGRTAEGGPALFVSQLAIDERIKELNKAFRESMNVMERRNGTKENDDDYERKTTATSQSTTQQERQASPVTAPMLVSASPLASPGMARAPSSGLARQAWPEQPPLTRRDASLPGGIVGEHYSIWDNRRARTESVGSAASGGLSELERARRLYGVSARTRGSVGSAGGASTGSEPVGKMEVDWDGESDRDRI